MAIAPGVPGSVCAGAEPAARKRSARGPAITSVTSALSTNAECNSEVDLSLPYATVASGAVSAFSDVNGNYTLTGVPAGVVTVTTSPRGRYFRTFRSGVDVPVTSGSGAGTVNLQLNTANTDETVRAGVNAYIQANLIRDLVARVRQDEAAR